MGTKEVTCLTQQNTKFTPKFQIGNKITKNLLSVSQLCSMGCSVYFGPAPSYDAYICHDPNGFMCHNNNIARIHFPMGYMSYLSGSRSLALLIVLALWLPMIPMHLLIPPMIPHLLGGMMGMNPRGGRTPLFATQLRPGRGGRAGRARAPRRQAVLLGFPPRRAPARRLPAPLAGALASHSRAGT